MTDMKVDQIVNQMRLMSAQATGVNNSSALSQSPAMQFSNVLQDVLGKVNELDDDAKKLKVAFEQNKPDVNLVDVMLASQKANIAFQGTVQVRNKLVAAYQDIMNMQL